MTMDWPEIIRRMQAGEELENLLDESALRDRAVMAQMFADMGASDLWRRYQERMIALDLGIDRAQAVWHSISDAQRRLVAALGPAGRYLERHGTRRFNIIVRFATAIGAESVWVCVWQPGLATVRNLAERELLEWTGGVFDSEASAVPTERLRFVLRHGPRTDIPKPWTSAPKPVPDVR
jgi:hypothetical protein